MVIPLKLLPVPSLFQTRRSLKRDHPYFKKYN
jgi:hypothetical protein